MERLRRHISRVEEVCREQAVLRKESSERIRTQIDSKLDGARQRREESIKKKKEIAQHAAEKKMYFDMLGQESQESETVKVTYGKPAE